MATTADFRNGMAIEVENEPYNIVEFLHVKPGKGQAFVRTKLKNIKTGAVLNKTFKAGEKVNEIKLERIPAEYLYNESDVYYFMNKSSYEHIPLNKSSIEDAVPFLKENLVVNILSADDSPVGIDLPTFVNLKVIETEPGVKGDTVTAATKPAKLETGTTIKVPLFISVGDVVKIDTRTKNYIERV